jgi:hypothetical protein
VRGTLEVGSWLLDAIHATTPVGRAESAHERGDSIFQIELDNEAGTSRTISAIEKVGFRLEQVASSAEPGSMIYIFRRTEAAST